jgi:hypothetical protein
MFAEAGGSVIGVDDPPGRGALTKSLGAERFGKRLRVEWIPVRITGCAHAVLREQDSGLGLNLDYVEHSTPISSSTASAVARVHAFASVSPGTCAQLRRERTTHVVIANVTIGDEWQRQREARQATHRATGDASCSTYFER